MTGVDCMQPRSGASAASILDVLQDLSGESPEQSHLLADCFEQEFGLETFWGPFQLELC